MMPKRPAPDLVRGGNRFSERSCPTEQISDESDSTQVNLGCGRRRRYVARAAHRRYHQPVAAAGTPVDLLAVAEAEFPGHANPDLAQPPVVAGHRDGAARQAGVGANESLLDLVR